MTTSSRRRRGRRVFKSSAARASHAPSPNFPSLSPSFSLFLYLFLDSSSFSTSLSSHFSFSLFRIPFLPVIFIAVLARSLARPLARSPACARARARAGRACRGTRISLQIVGEFAPRVSPVAIIVVVADERFRVCAQQRPMGDRCNTSRVILRDSRGGATQQ